jgi:hypothetical protein
VTRNVHKVVALQFLSVLEFAQAFLLRARRALLPVQDMARKPAGVQPMTARGAATAARDWLRE